MDAKVNKSSGAGKAQVFEVTMDDAEDQDELNRRYRKPGEPAYCASTEAGVAGNPPSNGSTAEAEQREAS